MIFSLDAKKPLTKIQNPFMSKILEKLGIKGIYLNMIKIKQQANNQNKIKWRRTQSDSTIIRNKKDCSSFQYNTLSSSLSNKTAKGDQDVKEEVKLLLFADDMIVYLTDPKNSTRQLLPLINTFSNMVGYKIT